MNITSKTLMIEIKHNVKIGYNDAIEATLVHLVHIFRSKKTGKIEWELDFVDVNNVKFMGIPIEKGYEGLKKFKVNMMEMGINVEEILDNEAAKLITDEDMEKLKAMYVFED